MYLDLGAREGLSKIVTFKTSWVAPIMQIIEKKRTPSKEYNMCKDPEVGNRPYIFEEMKDHALIFHFFKYVRLVCDLSFLQIC